MMPVKCPSCDSAWPEDVQFCGSCGTKLVRADADELPSALGEVNQQLKELLPQIGLGRFVEVAPGHHMCQRGSTHVDVRIIEFGDRVAVRSMAPVAIGSSLSPEMLKFLLNRNAGFIFGAFCVDPKGTVGFGHTILASSMDADELGASVRTVLQVADEYDDQLVARWGGKTAKQTAVEQILPAQIIRALRIAK